MQMLRSLGPDTEPSVNDVLSGRRRIPIIHDGRREPRGPLGRIVRWAANAFWHRKAMSTVRDMREGALLPTNWDRTFVGIEYWDRSSYSRVIMQHEDESYCAIPLMIHVIRVP